MDKKIWRNEIKYVCSEEELVRIKYNICSICRLDSNACEDGVYGVRSLYFDDYRNTCFRENENGTVPRKKYRIRIYNADTSGIYLECKYKERDMTRKDSCRITEEECVDLMQGKCWRDGSGQKSLLKRFHAEMAMRAFHPKVIVQYERTAYIYPVGNVRITFDRNIAMSVMCEDFLKQHPAMCPLMPADHHILEVKYNGIIPDFVYNALQAADLRQTSFSKYYISRKMQYMGRQWM